MFLKNKQRFGLKHVNWPGVMWITHYTFSLEEVLLRIMDFWSKAAVPIHFWGSIGEQVM